MKKTLNITLRILLALLVVYIGSIFFVRISANELMTEVKSIKKTLSDERKHAHEIELTGVTQKVLDYNQRLALMQKFSRNFIFKFHFPNEFSELEPIK